MTDRPLAYGSHPMYPHEEVCAACGLTAAAIKGLGHFDCTGIGPEPKQLMPLSDAERRECDRIAYEGRRYRIAKLRQHRDDMARMAEPPPPKSFAELTTAERLQRAMSEQDGSHGRLLGWPR